MCSYCVLYQKQQQQQQSTTIELITDVHLPVWMNLANNQGSGSKNTKDSAQTIPLLYKYDGHRIDCVNLKILDEESDWLRRDMNDTIHLFI